MSSTRFTQAMNKAVATLISEERSALIDQLSTLGYLNVPANTALAAVDGTSTAAKPRKLKGKRRVKVKASVAATSDDESQPDLIAQMVVNSGFQTSSFEEIQAPKVSKKAAKTAATRAKLIEDLKVLDISVEVLATSSNNDIRKMISEIKTRQRDAEKQARQVAAAEKKAQAQAAKAILAAEKLAKRKLEAQTKKAQAGSFTGVYPILNAKGEYLKGNKPNPTTGNPPLLRVKQNKETKALVMVAPGNWTPIAKRLFTQFQKSEDPSAIWKKRNTKKPAKKVVKVAKVAKVAKVTATVSQEVTASVEPMVQEVNTVVQEVNTVVQETKVQQPEEVDSSDDEQVVEENNNMVLFQTEEAEEAINKIISDSSAEQLEIPAVQLQEEDYEEEELELGSEQLWTHQGTSYFKTTYAGEENMVFDQQGELVGVWDPETDEIEVASWDDEE
jgi:hypothetical protein